MDRYAWAGMTIGVGVLWFAIYGNHGKTPVVVDEAREKRFQTVVAGAAWLKQSMKNPKSFELVSATMINGDTACYVYRGTNSFNAVVTHRRVITNSVNSGDDGIWNRHCAGRSGEDFSFARHAL